jgi:hypothetical protein
VQTTPLCRAGGDVQGSLWHGRIHSERSNPASSDVGCSGSCRQESGKQAPPLP